MTAPDTDPPDNVSDAVIGTLEESTDSQLEEIIHYAQTLLEDRPALTDAIEARESEELVRTEDHDGYTIVIVERPDATDEARGPFAYRVRWEPGTEGDEGSYRWHYFGKVSGGA